MRPPSSICKLHRVLAQTASLMAISVFVGGINPPAIAQGGYDTTETAPPEGENDRRPSPFADNERPPPPDENGNERSTPALPAVNDLEKWFSQYDGIRRKYENTPDERQYFESLASRRPGSGLSEGDYKFLNDMSERYAEAFNQMKEVEACSETQHLHRAYAMFLTEQSNIFNDYIRVLSDPDARDKRGRPLAPQMAERRRTVYAMEKNNHLLDVRTRRAFDVSSNPLDRRQQEQYQQEQYQQQQEQQQQQGWQQQQE